MNPLVRDILETLLRKGLTAVATYLVTVGLLTEGQATEVVTGLVLVGVSIAWSIWQRYKDRLILLTAIEAPPGTSEKQVKNLAKLPDAPSVLTVLLAGVVGASMLVAPACAGKSAPVLVGQTGLAIADGIGQMQTATKQLTEAGIVPPRTALTIQEALLRANDRLTPLPPLLRAIDAAQQANDPTAALVDQALALVQAVSGDLDLVINGVPISDAAKQFLALAQATRQTVTTLLTNLERLRAKQ